MSEIHQDLSEVETLLASRQRLADWLDKLETAGSKTPPAVRDRVRADYQARLSQIVGQLRGHSDVISSSLNGLRAQAEQFEQVRNEEQETLAEGELRHGVGEYTDDEWRRIDRDCTTKIRGFDAELDRLAGEIGRLEDVLTQIAPPAPTTPPRKPVREPEPVPAVAKLADPPLLLVKDEHRPIEAVASQPPPAASAPVAREPAEPPEAPRFVPRGGLKTRDSGPRTIPFPQTPAREPAAPPAGSSLDELTFLKSMTLDSTRTSGGAGASSPSAVAETKSERPSPTAAKTLKCGECGALNRPTEWYCERCGAELAAV